MPADQVEANGGPCPGGDSQSGGLREGAIAGLLERDGRQADSLGKAELASAATLVKMRDLPGAIAAATRSIERHPDNPRAFNLRAFARNATGDHSGAERDAKESIRLFPNNGSAYVNLAYGKLRFRKFREAKDAIEKALALNPNNALAHAVKAYIAEAMGDHAAAASAIHQAAELDSAFRGLDERARAGRSIYSPNDGDLALLAPSAGHGASPVPWEWVIGAVLLGGGLVGVGAWLARPRGSATSGGISRVSLTPVRAPDQREVGGRYELIRVIGRGGMGVVYEAMDRSLKRTVAVKKMTTTLASGGEKWRRLYVQEARTVAALHHPAIVEIFDVLEQKDEVYLVFEFVKGRTVQHLLAEQGCLSVEKALEILTPVCQALEAAHASNLVHRDLKPANIMITEEGGVKLMDFGLARTVPDASGMPDWGKQARTETAIGTPSYMSPESERGIIRKEGDLYALGVCLYEMLTGTPPFPPQCPTSVKEAMGFELASKRLQSLPAAVDQLIILALQPDPAKRTKRPQDFLDMLQSAAKKRGSTPV